jgi:hypothetical protein
MTWIRWCLRTKGKNDIWKKKRNATKCSAECYGYLSHEERKGGGDDDMVVVAPEKILMMMMRRGCR